MIEENEQIDESSDSESDENELDLDFVFDNAL